MARRLAPGGLILAGAMASIGSARAAAYDFTPLTTPSGFFQAGGLNDNGQVVGLLLNGATFGIPVLYANGTATPLALPTDAQQVYELKGITDNGLIVGSQGTTHFSQALAYQGGAVLNLGLPQTLNGTAYGANNQGQVVGFDDPFSGPQHGFLFSQGALTYLDVPGTAQTVLTGINDAGQIVGDTFLSHQGGFGFLFSSGSYTLLTAPGLTNILPTAINDAGEIVGTAYAASGQVGFADVGGVFSTIAGPDGSAFDPVGLNNSGQLVGTFFDDPAGTSELATPAAIAEPATLGVFAAAAALLGSLRRRRPGLTRSA